jgi:hypothetical protein
MSEFLSHIDLMVFSILRETTINGTFDKNEIIKISKNIFNIIKDIKYRIENNEKPDFLKTSKCVDYVNEKFNFDVRFIQKQVVKYSVVYDDDDKEAITKAIVIYKELQDGFKSVIIQLSNKWSEFKKLPKIELLV